ncbi:MAG: hypothetical protein Q4C00_08080 [Bacillota bacterium]|nr:hypothetical protein [Bacillota bacterium]
MSGHCFKYYKEAGVFNTLASNGGTISPNRSVNVAINLIETNERIALQNVAGQGRSNIWYFDYMSTEAIGQRTYMAVSTKYRYNNATRVVGTWSPDSR